MSCRDPKKACAECVFNRKVEPGAMGGSPIGTYIGQAFSPFAMPCHLHCDFEDPDWKAKSGPGETPQCAGLATFRANVGMQKLGIKVWEQLCTLPEDHETCFSNAEEFTSHHLGISLEDAYSLLRTPGHRIADFINLEMNKPGVRLIRKV